MRCCFRTRTETFIFIIENIKFRVFGVSKRQLLNIDFCLSFVSTTYSSTRQSALITVMMSIPHIIEVQLLLYLTESGPDLGLFRLFGRTEPREVQAHIMISVFSASGHFPVSLSIAIRRYCTVCNQEDQDHNSTKRFQNAPNVAGASLVRHLVQDFY